MEKILAQPGSFCRISMDGLNGSGKTWTSGLLAAGLAKEYGNGGPVVVFDSEDRWRFLKALLFDIEKIPLLIIHGTSIPAVQEAVDRAASQGASVFVGDQLTTPWMEGIAGFAFENGLLTFERRQQLVNEWQKFVRGFKQGHFHSIACGRLGFNWENVEDPDNGELKLVQGDSKFNAGGGNNFGYECDLELELRRRKRKLLALLRGKITVEHVCDVIKDATSLLNGKQFVFPDRDKPYQPGDYKQVLDPFRPHIEFMRRLETTPEDPTSSRSLIVGGKTAWAKDQTERKSLLEELDAHLSMCFPSGEGKSKLAKMFRDLTLEGLNGFISWSRMEEESHTEDIERNVLVVKKLRKRIESGEIPTSQESLLTLLNLATQDVLHPGQNVSFLEAMGKKTVESINAGRRSQAGD